MGKELGLTKRKNAEYFIKLIVQKLAFTTFTRWI